MTRLDKVVVPFYVSKSWIKTGSSIMFLRLFSYVKLACQVVTAEGCSKRLVPVDRKPSRVLCLRVLRVLWERRGAKTTVKDVEAAFLHYYKEPCTRQTLETQLNDIVTVTF